MLEKILKNLRNPVEIVIGKYDGLAKKFVEFAARLCSINEKISYVVKESEEFVIIRSGNIKIIYQCLPIKLEEFAKIILTISNKEVDFEAELTKEIKDVTGEIIAFTSPFCQHCGKIIDLVTKFAVVNPEIEVKIVDATHFSELSKEYNIVSLPTVIVNGSIKLTGQIDGKRLLNALKEDKYYDYKLGYYAYMLREGLIEELKKDIKTKSDARVVGDLLTHPMLRVRIGAMLLLEKIFKENPEIVEGAKPKIRKLLKHGDFRVKEDAALILGKIGDEADIRFLEDLLGSENTDVRDSALEAIEEIEGRRKDGN